MEKCSTSSPGGSQQNSTSLAQKKSSVPESTIEKRSTYEQATPERMKALGATLNSKENRESWLQKFSDTFTSDTLWVKEGGRWIKKIYKETKQYLAPYYEHEGEAFVPPSSSDSAVLKKLEEVEQ